MTGPTRHLAGDRVRELGSAQPAVTVAEADRAAGTWAGRRVLQVGGTEVFDLSFWCGTCPFLFERRGGHGPPLAIPDLSGRMEVGLEDVDAAVVGTFGDLLPAGRYLPLLLEVEPTLVHPGGPGDYFAEEQVATWGIDPVDGVPVDPGTPYYRGDTRHLGGDERLFELLFPLVPPSWNDRATVDAHAERLARSTAPTCVALGLLDVCQPAVAHTPEERLAHWCLSHVLLDGHHKIEAAAAAGARLRVLSLVSVDQSLAERSQVERLPAIFGQPPKARRLPFRRWGTTQERDAGS